MNNNRTLMSITERAECVKNSKAYSPADAAGRVKSIAKAIISELLTEDEKNTGVFSDDSSEYSGYCASVKAQAEENLSRADKSSCESAYGNLVADKIVSLAFMLAAVSNRFSRKQSKPQIYFDMRMTLGDYLDALIDLSFSEDGAADAARFERYRSLKKEFSESFDLSKPLGKAIEDILNQYSEPCAVLRQAAHIINCDSNVKYRIQEQDMREEFFNNYYYDDDYDYDESEDSEDTEDDDISKDTEEPEGSEPLGVFCDPEPLDEIEEAEITPAAFVTELEPPESRRERMELEAQEFIIDMDPYKYYFELAKKPQKGINLIAGGYTSAEKLLLLSGNYSPESLKQQADEKDLYPGFRALIDDMVTEESVSGAFRELDSVISKLYRLLVEPFAELGKYHFERHIA